MKITHTIAQWMWWSIAICITAKCDVTAIRFKFYTALVADLLHHYNNTISLHMYMYMYMYMHWCANNIINSTKQTAHWSMHREGLPKPQKGTNITPHMDGRTDTQLQRTSHTYSDIPSYSAGKRMPLVWLDRVLKLLAGCSTTTGITACEHDSLSGGKLRVDIALPLRIKGRLAEYDSHDCKV